MPLAIDNQVSVLDELLSRLEHCPLTDASTLALEHLRQARVYLLGAMYREYEFNLELARSTVRAMADRGARASIEELLSRLMDTKGHSSLGH
jgi:hypothetical protein